MRLQELLDSIAPEQAEKFMDAFLAIRNRNEEAWKAIVCDMTNEERDLLINICNEMIKGKKRKAAQHED